MKIQGFRRFQVIIFSFLGVCVLFCRLSPAQDETNLQLIFRSTNQIDYATLVQIDLQTGRVSPFLQSQDTYVFNMAWSPDGTKLAGLVIHNFKGLGSQSLFDLCIFTDEGVIDFCFDMVALSHPIVWTPDSNSIWFVSEQDNKAFHISMANLENNTIRQTLKIEWDNLVAIDDLVWAPKADQVAVHLLGHEDPHARVVRTKSASFIVNLVTTEMIELPTGVFFYDWSTDGRYLACSVNGVTKIYDVNTQEMLEMELVYGETDLIGGYLRWSHKEYKIALVGYPVTNEDDSVPYFCIYDFKKGNLDCISEFDYFSVSFSWSPDDSWLAFTKYKIVYAPSEIIVIDLEGQEQIFTEGKPAVWSEEPVWYPIVQSSE